MIVAIGDVHGRFDAMTRRIYSIAIDQKSPTHFIQVGDFGLGFKSPDREWAELSEMNEALQRSNSFLYVIRGNHDNPMYWHPDYQMQFSNIMFMRDDTYMGIDGKICYFAGGAISLDRIHRIQSVSYWKTESYKFDGLRPMAMTMQLDYIFTHDVPHLLSPYTVDSSFTKKWFDTDLTLRRDMIESQEQLHRLMKFLDTVNPLAPWYHGHYHASHTTFDNNGRSIYSLGILEFKEIV